MLEERPAQIPNEPEQVPDELRILRERIDTIDREILKHINERARVVQEVGKVKETCDTDIYIPSREKAILSKLDELNEGPLPGTAIHSIFREVISACRALESTLTVGYLGPEASYHHAVAQRHFGRSASFVPAPTINAIIDEVERKRVHFGVVAIENSIEGSVGSTFDKLAHSNVKILAETYLPISHNLISFAELHEIETVYSHPQALAQCRRWLESNIPKAAMVDISSTTLGVKRCLDEPKSAAIASALASEVFKVPIQVKGVEDFSGNTTRFYVIGHSELAPTGNDKTALVIFVRDKVGALYTMLEPFKRFGVNICNIVSRPVRQEVWQYMFFLELTGHFQDREVVEALEEIERNSLYIKILGSFPLASHPQ